jgi:hypothetical protein
MPKISLPKMAWAAGAVALVGGALGLVLFSARRTQAQDKPPLYQSAAEAHDAWKDFLYDKSSACMGCHAAPTAQNIRDGATTSVLLTESAIWRTHDKHAQAYAVLKATRGKQIADLLKQDVLKPETGCLGCHAMHNLLDKAQVKNDAEKQDFLQDGVSCAGCHGPSGSKPGVKLTAWFGDHQKATWRNLSAHSKYLRGMRDLRDPAVRAALCMSCHVGNAEEGKVVTHAMMAAGHPPLPPIDIATFSRNMPQHWRNPENVPFLKENANAKVVDNDGKETGKTLGEEYRLKEAKFSQTRLSLIGNVAAVRETAKLAHDRANFAVGKKELVWPDLALNPALGSKPEDRWPEIAMAHSDCFACHHDLKYPGFRQVRGFAYHVPGLAVKRVIPGRPMVRSWPLAGVAAGVAYTGGKGGTLDELKARLDRLTDATNAQPFGRPADITKAAKGLIDWSDGLVRKLETEEFTEAKVRKLVVNLCKLYSEVGKDGRGLPDYETARQIGSMIRVACLDLGIPAGTREPLDQLAETLRLEPYSKRDERLTLMEDVIWLAANKLKPPKEKPDDMFAMGFKEFRTYLGKLAKQEPFTKDEVDKLDANAFLTALARRVDNENFNNALLKKKDQLQDLSDAEEKLVLQAVAGYDPAAFCEALAKIQKAIAK